MLSMWLIRLVLLSRVVVIHDGASEEIRVATWNLERFFVRNREMGQARTPVAMAKTMECLTEIGPDILLVQELGGEEALKALQERLNQKGLEFQWTHLCEASDPTLHLGLLSRYPIEESCSYDSDEFLHAGQIMKVRRGVQYCRVALPSGKRLHVVNLHLKSRRDVTYGDSRIIREQEASIARRIINEIHRHHPVKEGPLIVAGGDFNDHPSSRTLRILKGSGRQALHDPEPAELNGDRDFRNRSVRWTLFFEPEDSYSRSDYLLVSKALESSIDRHRSGVHACADWGMASDHRPVFLTLKIGQD